MAQSIEEAVQQARKMETDGINFYTKLAQKCSSEAGQAMFQSFTED